MRQPVRKTDPQGGRGSASDASRVPRGAGTGGRRRLRGRRVGTRLATLILLPTVVAVLVAVVQPVGAVTAWADQRRLAEIAALTERLGTLAHETGAERTLTAWYLADPTSARRERVAEQRARVDAAARRVTALLAPLEAGGDPRLGRKAKAVRERLAGIETLRAEAFRDGAEPRIALDGYRPVVDAFLALADELGRYGDADLGGDAVALGALSRAKEELSRQIGGLLVAVAADRFDAEAKSAFLVARERELAETALFQSEASAATLARYHRAVGGERVAETDRIRGLVSADGRDLDEIAPDGGDDARHWYENATAVLEQLRTVERDLAGDLAGRAADLRDRARTRALVAGGGCALLLALALLITGLVAASLARPLRRLHAAAVGATGDRPGTAAPEPASPDSADGGEIGELARAFDELHRETARLAAEQERLRGDVAALLGDLSRRAAETAEHQRLLLAELERGEYDERRLGALVRLGRLADRMRRTGENLLLATGQEPPAPTGRPAPLTQVVRAALAQVADGERVIVHVRHDPVVAGEAVRDVTHLLAELAESALAAGATPVIVTSSAGESGGVLLSVSDHGPGMTDEELAAANAALAAAPEADGAVPRHLGLAAAGRLARRHGIQVRLRRREEGGVGAMVLLPDALLSAGPASGMGLSAGPASGMGLSAGPASGVALPAGNPPGAGLFGAPYGTGAHGGTVPRADAHGDGGRPSGPDVHTAAPVDTPWPGSLPPPGSATGGDTASGAGRAAFPAAALARDEDLRDPQRRQEPWDPWKPRSPAGAGTGVPPAAERATPAGGAEYLPIFASVESEWFRRAGRPAPAGGASAEEEIVVVQGEEGGRAARRAGGWSSPADAGWRAAQAIGNPVADGVTDAGLPKRVPRANLVPGSVGTDATSRRYPAPALSPEGVRDRLAGFQQGVRQGRAAARGLRNQEQAHPGGMPGVDGYKEDP
nr:MAG: hypothetical protein DIU60_00380 [Actinomycetota bacterium]